MSTIRLRSKRPSRQMTDTNGFHAPQHTSCNYLMRAMASEARGGPRRILRAFPGLYRGLAGGLQLRVPAKSTWSLSSVGVGGLLSRTSAVG